jgi:hypothetical protein
MSTVEDSVIQQGLADSNNASSQEILEKTPVDGKRGSQEISQTEQTLPKAEDDEDGDIPLDENPITHLTPPHKLITQISKSSSSLKKRVPPLTVSTGFSNNRPSVNSPVVPTIPNNTPPQVNHETSKQSSWKSTIGRLFSCSCFRIPDDHNLPMKQVSSSNVSPALS